MEKIEIINIPHFLCRYCKKLLKIDDGFCESCNMSYQIEKRGGEYFVKNNSPMIKTRMLLVIEPKPKPIFLLLSGIRPTFTTQISEGDLLEIEADYIDGRCPEMIFQKVQYVSYQGNKDPHNLFDLLGVEEGEVDDFNVEPMIRKFHVEQ